MAKKSSKPEKANDQFEDGLIDALSFESEKVKPTLALAKSTLSSVLTPEELQRVVNGDRICLNIVCSDKSALRPICGAISEMCKGATRIFYGFEDGVQTRGSRYHSIPESFAAGEGGIVVVANESSIPDVAKIVGERTIAIQSLGRDILAGAIRQSLPGRMPRIIPEIDLALVDFQTIAACLGISPDAKSAAACLVRAIELKTAKVPTPPAAPTLEDAVEFGEAQRWGLELKRDLADYRAGKISWKSVDRGAVLHGPPGTGKSLFAASLANACAVPLVATSVAEYFTSSAGHLGDVLKRQAATFAEARAKAPCILFLDEINSLPNIASFGGKNNDDWWRPVVLDFFVQLDSLLSDRDGVVVVTATNSLEDVSKALLRNGRLERALYVGELDAAGAERVFRYHLGDDLKGDDLEGLANLASGSTPATIMGWVRSAQRWSRRKGHPMTIGVLQREILRNSAAYSDDDMRRIAIHEAGHAFAAAVLPGLHLIDATLVSTENGFGHVRIQRGYQTATKENLENEAAFLLAGHAAELVILGNPSTGSGGPAFSDLAQATSLICSMFTSHGFDEEHMAWRCEPAQSAAVIHIDGEVRGKVSAAIKELLARLQELILSHSMTIEEIASQLMDRRFLTAASIHEITATIVEKQPSEQWIAGRSPVRAGPIDEAA